MNLVLDIDETLLHSNLTGQHGYDFRINVSNVTYYVKKRPRLDKFLKFVYHTFNTVSYWTAGIPEYAYAILQRILTPEQRHTTLLVYTRKELEIQGINYHKPLKKLFAHTKARDHGLSKKNTIMVDDISMNFLKNQGNGLEIPSYLGQTHDKVLSQLIIVLNGMVEMKFPLGDYDRHLKLIDICN